MTHLWAYDHPFYGDGGQSEEMDSFAELQQALAGHPPRQPGGYRP